jgi:polysaccharide deacetylase family protein (PEP-CTERM system associated)
LADAKVFLFSVDLEDVRSMIPEGERYADRVPANTERYLDLLARHGARCTFFTVGDVVRRHPELVRCIAAAGHEVACHGADHVQLDRQDAGSFRRDLERTLEDLARAGVHSVRGYRAPTFSLTARTRWAYEVLAELGFAYSSSVLPARNPLYGWPGFGSACRRTEAGIWEIPMSLLPGLAIPFAGGVYFRVLPFPLIRALFARRFARGEPVVGYFHPYDVDTEQEHFMHPALGGNRLYNRLMYVNRGRVLARLERLLEPGVRVLPYAEYVGTQLEARVP